MPEHYDGIGAPECGNPKSHRPMGTPPRAQSWSAWQCSPGRASCPDPSGHSRLGRSPKPTAPARAASPGRKQRLGTGAGLSDITPSRIAGPQRNPVPPTACRSSPDRSVVENQLQPVTSSCPEQEDRSRERVLAQHRLHMRNKAVVLLPEINWLRRNHDPNPVRRENHDDAFSAETISASRTAGTAASRRTVTPVQNHFHTRAARHRNAGPLPDHQRTNSTAGSTAAEPDDHPAPGGASPSAGSNERHISAQTLRTVAPGSSVSATIRALTSSGQRRRPPRTASTSTLLRVSVEAAIVKLTPDQIEKMKSQITASTGRCRARNAYRSITVFSYFSDPGRGFHRTGPQQRNMRCCGRLRTSFGGMFSMLWATGPPSRGRSNG